MEKVAFVSEIHCDATGNGSRNDFFITHRTTRLNHSPYSSVNENLKPISEREERVARRDAPRSAVAGAGNGEVARVNAIHLTHSNTDRCTAGSKQDGV